MLEEHRSILCFLRIALGLNPRWHSKFSILCATGCGSFKRIALGRPPEWSDQLSDYRVLYSPDFAKSGQTGLR